MIGTRVRVVVPQGHSTIASREGVVAEVGPNVLGCPSSWAMVRLDGDAEPYCVSVWNLEASDGQAALDRSSADT